MDDTKRRLIEAAGEEFAERGYDAATIRDICQKAGANLAAVNYHFGDKRRLYIEAVRAAHCARTEERPMPVWPEDMPAVERFREFVKAFIDRMIDRERPHWHLELMLRELARPTEACHELVRDYIRPMAEQLELIVREMMPDADDDLGWRVGFSVVAQCLFYYFHRPIIEDLIGAEKFAAATNDLLADHIARFSLAAIGYLPPLANPVASAARGAST